MLGRRELVGQIEEEGKITPEPDPYEVTAKLLDWVKETFEKGNKMKRKSWSGEDIDSKMKSSKVAGKDY